MDQKDALDIARQYASIIQMHYDVMQIFLFGSYSNQTYHSDSDIDIAVIIKDFKNPIDTQLELMRLRRNVDSRIEPHPYREKDFNISNPFFHEIMKSGLRIDS